MVDSPRSTTPPGRVYRTLPCPCQSLPTSSTRPCASSSIAAATTNSRRATDPCGRCDRSTGPAARQRPSLFLGRQRLGELAQVSGKDAGEVASRVVDAVIGDPRLREVVGPDALRALTGADLHQARLAGLA